MTRILYVDDEADIREVAAMALELEPSFEVRTASSGPEAIEVAAYWSPEVVLLDVMMPGMDGPTTFGSLRELPQLGATPIIFITARTQAHDVEALLKLGAAGVIAKPFDAMNLAHEVREIFVR